MRVGQGKKSYNHIFCFSWMDKQVESWGGRGVIPAAAGGLVAGLDQHLR